MPTPIVGRRVLESIRCDNREMLLAVQEKYGSDIYAKDRLTADGNEEGNSGRIAALFGESVFHNAGAIERDAVEDDDIYVDFGDDTPDR